MSKIRTVIADDMDPILKYLEKVLSDTKEYEIVGKATNGKELVETVIKEKPQLVISDVQMPEYSGIDAVKELKGKNIYARYILITGHDDPEINTQAKNLGVTKVIIKPILDDKRFIKQIEEAMNMEDDYSIYNPKEELEKIIRYDEVKKEKNGLFKRLWKLIFRDKIDTDK